MIKAGTLKDRISLLTKALQSIATVWADIKQVSAREQIRNSVDIQDNQYTIRIRHISGITNDDVVMINNFYYSIDSIQNNKDEGEIIIAVSYDPRLNNNTKVET